MYHWHTWLPLCIMAEDILSKSIQQRSPLMRVVVKLALFSFMLGHCEVHGCPERVQVFEVDVSLIDIEVMIQSGSQPGMPMVHMGVLESPRT